MKTILARYHDEQVWSDKIRSASTYGTMAAIALNLLVFITATLLIEPWKRRRMAKMFEKKIEELNEQNALVMKTGMANLTAHFEAQGKLLQDIAEPISGSASSQVIPSQSTTIQPDETAPSHLDNAFSHTKARMVETLDNRELVVSLALCAMASASMGWLARMYTG